MQSPLFSLNSFPPSLSRVSGLVEITMRGGLSLVQSPREAAFPVMIQHALAEDDVDAILDLDALAEVLVAISQGKAVDEDALIR